MPSSATPAPIPASTYRLQFHKEFTFRHALELLDYLSRLGVTHIYASPILEARPGSTHGYDIVNHGEVNPELGTPEDFEGFVAALHARGMGLIIDIVPNHMGVGGKDNAWWLDTLEWGELSPHSKFFDIDYATHRRGMRGKVMVPVLGDHYGKVLESGDLVLRFDAASGSFSVWYHEHRFPIDPRDYGEIFGSLTHVGSQHHDLLGRFIGLAQREADAYPVGQALKQELARHAREDDSLARYLEQAVDAMNGTPGELVTWLRLHALLERQSYRPTYYRAAADEINYRRFFNINDLAGVRVELEELYEQTHRLVLDWVAAGKVQGLRIDHIDGLFDPAAYCQRLRDSTASRGRPAYVVVEKILATHERLPTDWAIAGTTGYDSVNLINGVFVDAAGEHALDRIYRHFTRRHESFDEVLVTSKKLVMQTALASEMNVLANELHRISSADLMSRDFTLRSIRDAIEDVFVHMPVYRTYVTAAGRSEQDVRYVQWAVGKARKESARADTTVFDFLETVLMGEVPRGSGASPDEVVRVAMRAQQVSGPVMAKGMEDTAFYRYQRLISLNEVGGDPRRFGVSLAAFHRQNQERLEQWPHDMLAGSTHDTKRGEDARARINVLSELPREWLRQVDTWMRVNRSRRTELDGAPPMPDPNDEYLYYQSLVGAWPLDLRPGDEAGMAAFSERMAAFMLKAVRESKDSTSWDNPNLPYEQALDQFVRETLRSSATNPFPEQMATWVARVARAGAVNSLGQTLLRLTIPGVPDTYRGSELWDLSLVDPDNRRPVDYAARRELLGWAERFAGQVQQPARRAQALAELSATWQDGREKLHVLRTVLTFRREHPELFHGGRYTPLSAAGALAEHVCAFTRSRGEEQVVVVVPRLIAKLSGAEGAIDWRDTTLDLPGERYRCLLSGTRLEDSGPASLGALLGSFPVAFLVCEQAA